MIIGVDAGMLGVTDKRLQVGVWRVAVNLLRELGQIDQENSYRLYSFRPFAQALLAEFGPRMQNLVLKPTWGWFSWRLPLELSQNPVDVFLGLAQALPKGPGRKIGLIYDLGFLSYPELYPGSAERLKKQTEELISRADHIITISEAVKADISSHYSSFAGKMTVAYPGVAPIFSPEGKIYQAKTPYLLFVGALKPQKNVPLLLTAFKEFQKQCAAPVSLYLVGGDYWLDPQISQKLKELGLSERLKIFGHISDEELASLYRGATALVIPSLVEGFCLPAVEAMASGIPVVGADLGPLPEILGNAGILFPPGDAAKLTVTLQKIWANETLRRKVKRAGLTLAKKYQWPKFARIIYEVISKTA